MVSTALETHPKYRAYLNGLPRMNNRLVAARGYFLGYLWLGESREWNFAGLTAQDIAVACGWTRDPHLLLGAFLVAKIIRKVGDDYEALETTGILHQASSSSPKLSEASRSFTKLSTEQTRADASNSTEQQPSEAGCLGVQTRLDSDKTKKESSLNPKDSEEEAKDVKPCTGWYGKRAEGCMGFRGKIPEGGGHYFAACSSCMGVFGQEGSARAPRPNDKDEPVHPRVKALFREAAKPKLMETEEERESRIEESRKRTLEVIAARGITQEDMDEARLKTSRSREA